MKKAMLLTGTVLSAFLAAQPALTSAYTVKKGDNLTNLSKKYKTTVDKIMVNNNLTDTTIQPGQVLKIDEEHTHHVVKGDTLSEIAEKYGTTIAELLKLNKEIVDANLIYIGDTIRYATDSSSHIQPSADKEEQNPASYVVQYGDSLYKIAKDHGLTVNYLLSINPEIKNKNFLTVGQMINLSGTPVKSSETGTSTTEKDTAKTGESKYEATVAEAPAEPATGTVQQAEQPSAESSPSPVENGSASSDETVNTESTAEKDSAASSTDSNVGVSPNAGTNGSSDSISGETGDASAENAETPNPVQPDESGDGTQDSESTSGSTVTKPSNGSSSSSAVTKPSNGSSSGSAATKPSTDSSSSSTVTKPSNGSSSSSTVTKPSNGSSSSSTVTKPSSGSSSSSTVTKPSSGSSSSSTVTKPSSGSSSSSTVTKPSSGSSSSSTVTKPGSGTVSATSANIVATAQKYLGASYKYGASTSSTTEFDCSSLTYTVYRQAGINLPRTSVAQANSGKTISLNSIAAGDLVFFDTDFDGVINHVGIHAGNGQMIHASSSKGVSYANIYSSYWVSRIAKVVRVL